MRWGNLLNTSEMLTHPVVYLTIRARLSEYQSTRLTMAYELPKLSYAYDALVPHIDAKTMEIHHSKHHQAYITNVNKALADAGVTAPECVCELISDLSKLPESIRGAVRNNGGGH